MIQDSNIASFLRHVGTNRQNERNQPKGVMVGQRFVAPGNTRLKSEMKEIDIIDPCDPINPGVAKWCTHGPRRLMQRNSRFARHAAKSLGWLLL